MSNIVGDIIFFVLVYDSVFCIEYFIIIVNNVLKYCRVLRGIGEVILNKDIIIFIWYFLVFELCING